MPILADLAVMGSASILLLTGSSKLVRPSPIAATLAMLWNTVTGQDREAAPPMLGRLLGVGEMGLAAATVVGRSPATAVALALFAIGLAGAGVIGVMSDGKLPCACFGASDRSLGYPHILQLPLWLVTAWAVTGDPALFGTGAGLEQGLAMLAVCAIASTAFHVAKMWHAVYPIVRQGRRGTADRAAFQAGSGGS